MNLVAIMPVRNEDWVLGLSARAVLRWADSLAILDHASTDGTPQVIDALMAEFPGRVHSMTEPDPEWREMAHRQRLLEFARCLGATHIAAIDADEVLAGDMIGKIRDFMDRIYPGQRMAIPMRNLHRSLNQYRSDPSPFGSKAETMFGFRDSPRLHWQPKDGYDHHQRSPAGSTEGRPCKVGGGLMHLQFASWRRLTAKHAAYRVMERLKYPAKPVEEIERTYSLATDERGLQLSPVPAAWWEPYADILHHLDLDRDPWQEAEARRLVELHGAEYFNGLSLLDKEMVAV